MDCWNVDKNPDGKYMIVADWLPKRSTQSPITPVELGVRINEESPMVILCQEDLGLDKYRVVGRLDTGKFVYVRGKL